jgi:phage terminase large subunit-like protein
VATLGHAIDNGACTHGGSAALTRHVLNARRRATRTGYLLYKAHPESPDKIDAAYAAVMAWKARLDAVSAGVAARRGKPVIARVRGGVLGR